MTIFDLIKKAAGPASDLLQFLNMVAIRFPDTAPKAQELVAQLSAAVDVNNLTTVAGDVVRELGDIGQGKIDPRSHPSDA